MSCKYFTFILMLLSIVSVQARDHLIYSIEEEVPMGYAEEVNKKNYFVNMGSNQGVEKGTTLDVYRIISKLNPYNNQKRINHKVKIGELKVLYSTNDASIGRMDKFLNGPNTPLLQLEDFMIGDHVDVSVND